MRAIRLKTEYLTNPLGIGAENPRLFWKCQDGVRQTAYQIRTDKWDSGRVESASMHADYPLPLDDRERVEWRVRLWDESGSPGEWSEPAFFEKGISSWEAAWITGNYRVNKKKRYPVDCFRRTFRTGAVRSARLYVTACGLYEILLNGKRAGDFVLAPGITDYRKRIQYQTFDVTDLLKEGENELTAQVADGWYRGSTGAWGMRNQYGSETALLCQLEITAPDGARQTIASDESWAWSQDGPIRFADNKDGEIVDANLRPGYGGHAKRTKRRVIPTASDNVPLREHERFTPSLIRTHSGKTVLDFGQNIAGTLSFRVRAHKGQKIVLTCGELLDKSGELTLSNIQCVNKKIRTPLQRIEYTCAEGMNEYKTRFAIFGFRYAEVSGDVKVCPGDFEAAAVYSDMEDTLSFDSSNELLNRFVSCVRWSTKNNSADLPTDCPTRERHGWTGDAQIFFGTAAYLFDYAAFSRKFVRDMYDWQRRNGCLPQIAPAGGVDFYMNPMNGSVGWADAGILIPYRFWKRYGDERILKDFYPGMKKYARFMMRRCGKTGLFAKPLGLRGEARRYAVNAGQSYGEWAEPADVHPYRWTDMAAPHPEVSTAYTSYVMGILGEIADRLGEPEDAALYRKYRDGCRKAYQSLVERPEYTLDTDRQASLVRPLYMDLLTEEQKAFAEKRLLKAVKNYSYRVGTGFLSTPLILYVLGELDLDAAYRMLENEEMPGWLYMPKSGADTVWENWEGTSSEHGIASLDHYSKGAVLEWVISVMCGIRADGENRFTVAPCPGGRFTRAEAEYKSVYGTIKSGWEKTDGKTVYTISVPPGCTAEILLPGEEPFEVEAGVFRRSV